MSTYPYIFLLTYQYMKMLIKKVDKSVDSATGIQDTVEQKEEKPKKIRNRPLLHVKVRSSHFL